MENNTQNAQNTQVAAQAQQNPQGAANAQQNSAPAAADAGVIAAAVMNALDTRQQRTERSVIKSFAEQNGVSVEEITKLVTDYKAKQATAIPADVQQRIDERMRTADNRLISAEVRAVGTELNIIDIDAAFALMDKSGVKVGDDGSVTGVKEALEALATARPWLVKQAAPSPSGTGSTGNFPRGNGGENADFASRLAAARALPLPEQQATTRLRPLSFPRLPQRAFCSDNAECLMRNS